MNASLVPLTWLSITGPQSSLQGFLTFLQISHVPASRSRSQLRSELERKHTSLRSPSYPRLSARVQARGLGVMLEIKQASQEQHPLLLPLPPGKVRRAPPALLSLSADCPPVPQATRPLLTGGGLRALFSSLPPSSGFFLSPSHLFTPRSTTATPHLQLNLSFHFPPLHSPPVNCAFFAQLSPGNQLRGGGAPFESLRPTHSYHMCTVIGGSQHPPPPGGGAAAGRWPEVRRWGRLES